MDFKQQVASAVHAALNPGPSQAEAYQALEGLKQAPESTWTECLEIFLQGSPSSSTPQQQQSGGGSSSNGFTYAFAPEVRLFALQVVDEVIEKRWEGVEQQARMAVQAGLLEYVQREYVQGDAEGQLFYLRNKVVHTLFLLFMQTYTSTWPDFFQAFFQLIPSPTSSSAEPYNPNPKTTDLLLRLLHEVSMEISDRELRLNKAHARLNRDTDLRDAVRAKDARLIATQTIQILIYVVEKIDNPSAKLSSAQALSLAEMSMRVLADYASWIDISHIVTPTFLPVLFQCLSLQHTSIRLVSADLWYELVTKGMPPTDKLELLKVLNISEAITHLLDADDGRKNGSANGSNGHTAGPEELFREKLARVLNGLGIELTKIADDSAATDQQRETAKSAALAQRPLALRFLADEYDDTSSTVITFVQAILNIYKKEKKRDAAGHFTAEKAEFLSSLLSTTIQKMRYSSEEEWGGDDDDEDGEDEEVIAFAEMRRTLKTIFDNIATIDYSHFSANLRSFIVSTLDSIDAGDRNGGSSPAWNDVEVALYVLYIYGETTVKQTGTSGAAVFVQVPPEELQKVKKTPEHKIDYNAYNPSILGELMLRTIQSNIASWPHPSVPMQLFECVSRYHDFFVLVPHTIPAILPPFLDQRGLHQDKLSIRNRCFYLFNRFVSTARPSLTLHLGADAVADICRQVQDLLTIEASVPAPETPGEDVLTKAASRGSPFDSQLYLFEALGSLISLLMSAPNEQVALLRALLEPLLSDLQALETSASADPDSLLKLHHLIKAVGSIAYGFPELKNTTTAPPGQWVQVLQEAMKIVLGSLKAKSNIAIVREASLGAFKSVAARTGEAALPLVAPLIDCLVDHLTASEVIDFLPFIGMLTHRYKAAFVEMLDVVLEPVFDRTYFFLEQPITGTDDIQQHSELRRAYFALLQSISTAGMSQVFFSRRNAPSLETLLGSIPHYLGNSDLLLDQRAGFQLVNRFVVEWVKPSQSQEPSPIPQFKDFLYERILPLSLELPVRQNFDYGDAQAYQVIGEVAILHTMLYKLRSDEFMRYLSTTVFPRFNMPQDTQQEYLKTLAGASDGRAFKKWLAPFFQRAKPTLNDKPYSVAHLLAVTGQQ